MYMRSGGTSNTQVGQAAKHQSHQSSDEDSDSSTEYINKLESITNSNTVNSLKITTPDTYADMIILSGNKRVTFQVDSGAKINTIPASMVQEDSIQPQTTTLKMWNNATCTAIGQARLKIRNPANEKKYSVAFTVVNDDLTPLLGNTASQQMGLITVNHENITATNTLHAVHMHPQTEQKPEIKYAEVLF